MKNFHYALKYRIGEESIKHCPDCNSTQWIIGRNSVECACCDLPLPIEGSKIGAGTFAKNFSRTAEKKRI